MNRPGDADALRCDCGHAAQLHNGGRCAGIVDAANPYAALEDRGCTCTRFRVTLPMPVDLKPPWRGEDDEAFFRDLREQRGTAECADCDEIVKLSKTTPRTADGRPLCTACFRSRRKDTNRERRHARLPSAIGINWWTTGGPPTTAPSHAHKHDSRVLSARATTILKQRGRSRR